MGSVFGRNDGAVVADGLGPNYTVDVFTGSTRYIFNFKVAGREKITTSSGLSMPIAWFPGRLRKRREIESVCDRHGDLGLGR